MNVLGRRLMALRTAAMTVSIGPLAYAWSALAELRTFSPLAYRLTIDGQTPTSGVLMLQSGSNLDGAGGLPGDNLITAVADGDGWLQADGKRVLLTVGRLTRRKGHDVVLQSLARLRSQGALGDVAWLVLSDGEIQDELRAQCRGLGLDDIVSFIERRGLFS